MSRHDISKKKYQLLINEVLVDFTDRTNLGENLWDTIDNPKEYCDRYTNKYVVKKKSLGIVVRDYSLLFIGWVFTTFILLAISEMYIVTFTLPKVIIYFILLICISLVYLIQKKRLF